MNAVSPLLTERPVEAASLVLRVLSGRSDGAEHRLPQQRKLLIGHSFESDIVLRDTSTRGCALRLTVCGRRAVLEVESGQVCLLGKQLVAGETITLEQYLPVRIGNIHFALGGDDDVRWDEARSIIAEDEQAILELAQEAPPSALPERLALRSEPIRRNVAKISLRPARMAMIGAGLLVVAAGSYFGATMLSPPPPTPRDIRQELAPFGLTGVTVERSPTTGEIAITGLVKDASDAARLREWAQQHHPDILVNVSTIAEAAEAATNLLTAQNVDAVARPLGADRLVIEGPFLPKDRQNELTRLLEKDLPRVAGFTFRPSAERGESGLAYFFNAPGYGAASFVSGDPGYIVTEDGTRWFPGANLPTGHKIIEITGNTVTVERDGLRDVLTM
jgi:type III secretion system YscD/HrpQ family protein